MRNLATVFLFLLSFFLLGCKSARRPEIYLSHFNLKVPATDDFEVCKTAGCRNISELSYTASEWASIRSIFEPTPTTPSAERERIQIAVGLMEQIIGVKNGTSGDAPKNDRHLGTGNQLDCIAEAANTTVALMLLDKEGLLHHHRLAYPQHRGFFQGRLPHNTASIYELDSGDHYAVDSWFFKNGEPPVCVPVNVWRAGYDPND